MSKKQKVFLGIWIVFCVIVLGLAFTFLAPAYPTSALDGRPNVPGSWHAVHVDHYFLGVLYLQDGSQIPIQWSNKNIVTELVLDKKGVLYVSVPLNNNKDDDNTYIFQRFSPDPPPYKPVLPDSQYRFTNQTSFHTFYGHKDPAMNYFGDGVVTMDDIHK